MVCSLSRALLEWLGRGELEVGEDEEEDDTEGGKLQQLLLLLQAPPLLLLPPLPPQGSLSFSREATSSPRSERTRLSGTLRPSLSSISLRSGSGTSSMTFAER